MPWERSLTGVRGSTSEQDITRAYGQTGVRVSLPFWKVHPTVQSMLFNLNGLAHKVTLVSDLYWADASQDIDEFPLYDPLDDDSQEHFRGYLGTVSVVSRPAQLRVPGGTAEPGLPRRRWKWWMTWRPRGWVSTSAGKPNAGCRDSNGWSTGSCWILTARSSPTRTATTSGNTWDCWNTTSAGTSAIV